MNHTTISPSTLFHSTRSQHHSSNESRRGGSVILERGRDLLLGFVVPSKTVDPGFDEDKTELGVLVFPVDFEVLADGNRLFDEVPKVLRDGWAKSYPQTKRYTRSARGRKEQRNEREGGEGRESE